MKLLYSAEITARNKTLTLPFGVKRCKMRSSAQTPIITGIGPIGTTSINACTSLEFPIINGTSPNTFTTTFGGTETLTIYVLVEELGGIPDPDYFTREVTASE